MKVQTKAYGEMEVNERQRLRFPHGLFGFEDLHEYVLLDAGQQPFFWLQSTDRVEVAFVLLDPRVFLPDYRLDVGEEELRELGVEAGEDVIDFVIITIPEDPSGMTANLQGPVVINRRTRLGKQCISRDPEMPVRYRVMDALAVKK